MQFIQEHKVNNIEEYNNILNNIDVKFEKSQVYHVSTETKTVNEDKRLSNYRVLRDEKIFSLVESLIETINSKQSENGKKFFLRKIFFINRGCSNLNDLVPVGFFKIP